MNKEFGIFNIKNKINGKNFISYSYKIDKAILNKKKALKLKNPYFCKLIKEDFDSNNYELDDFEFTILKIFKNDEIYSDDTIINIYITYYMKKYNSVEKGYNSQYKYYDQASYQSINLFYKNVFNYLMKNDNLDNKIVNKIKQETKEYYPIYVEEKLKPILANNIKKI